MNINTTFSAPGTLAIGMATSRENDQIDPQDGPLHFPTGDRLQHTKSMNEVIRNAKTATDSEHSMSLLQGIKLYPKAVAWSILISTCICMEGYDVCLLNNFCECEVVDFSGF